MSKEILINVDVKEVRAAVVEKGRIEDFFIDRLQEEKVVSNIYKGKVSSIVKGMGAAFINIGFKRNGFLFVSDIIALPSELKDILENGELSSSASSRAKSSQKIEEILRKDQEVIVQVVKEPIGRKGPRLTTQISLPGRYLVLMPYAGHFGVSKKIRDEKERRRLKEVLASVQLPKEMGLIARTVSQGKSKQDLMKDLSYLMKQWRQIKVVSSKKNAPALLHREDELLFRIVRDYFSAEVNKVIIDSRDEFNLLLKYVSVIVPEYKKKVFFYKDRDKTPLFEKCNIESQIAMLYERKVPLHCGGHIVIEPTEGLTAIDVNSGRFTGRRNLEETVFKVNMEAASEIARQIRLRDLGGIIIIDFIDMSSRDHRRRVFELFERELASDRAKKNILRISEIGVVQMTRQRIRKDVGTVYYTECPYCKGRGLIKSVATMSIEVFKQIHKFLKTKVAKGRFGKRYILEISVNPKLCDYIVRHDAITISRIERAFRAKLIFVPKDDMHFEDTKLMLTK